MELKFNLLTLKTKQKSSDFLQHLPVHESVAEVGGGLGGEVDPPAAGELEPSVHHLGAVQIAIKLIPPR